MTGEVAGEVGGRDDPGAALGQVATRFTAVGDKTRLVEQLESSVGAVVVVGCVRVKPYSGRRVVEAVEQQTGRWKCRQRTEGENVVIAPGYLKQNSLIIIGDVI